MRLNKQNKIIVGVLAFLLTLTVGYAVFSQSLNITGTAKASGDFNLIFEKDTENSPTCNGYSNDCNIDLLSSISTDKKTLTITVGKLNYPSAYVQIPVKVKNEGSLDALLEKIEVNGLSNDDIEVTYSITDEEIEKGYVIKSGNSKDMTVKVLWKEKSTNTNPETLSFNITLKYVQATNLVDSGSSDNTNNCTTFTKKDNYEVGDVIAFCDEETGKSEDFYVISDNGTTVTALAKYNLLVGNKVVFHGGDFIAEALTGNEEDYGFQSKKTTFEIDSKKETPINNILYGMIPFANKGVNTANDEYGYWVDSSGNLLGDYKETDTSTYPAYVYDNNSNLYAPLQNYKTTLEGLKNSNGTNIKVIDIRPIKQEELVSLGCDSSKYTCKTDDVINNNRKWLYEGLDYWTASAGNYDNAWAVCFYYDAAFVSYDFWNDVFAGLRPVIEIQKTNI